MFVSKSEASKGASIRFVPGTSAWNVGGWLCVILLLLLPMTSLSQGTPRVAVSPSSYYSLSEIRLPNWTSLSQYVDNYHGEQYPIYDYSGRYSGDLVYVDSSSRMAWYDPQNGMNGVISKPLTLLYQKTSGVKDQIDNEFQLDTPFDVALSYGNLTTHPGNVTLETVDLSNGSIQMVTAPVLMENNLQADYIGNGIVVVFNATSLGGSPTYLVDMYNSTSWYAGANVGISANNIYWVWQLNSFVDVQGERISQYRVEDNSLLLVASVWFNDSSISSISGVNGAIYDSGLGKLAFWDSTNAGWFYTILNTSEGLLTPGGSYGYFSDYLVYVERYSFTSPYVWAVDSPPPSLVGPTVLFSPFNNSTVEVPNLVTRDDGTGGGSNYELEDPYSTATYGSFNGSLLGMGSLGSGDFVWASLGSPPPSKNVSQNATPPGGGVPLEGEWYFWVVFAAVVVVLAVAVITLLPPREPRGSAATNPGDRPEDRD